MTRIKLVYPKMPGSGAAPLEQCIAFEKYDGTNLHWVWEKELGWYAFGTRRDRFDLDDEGKKEFDAIHPGLEEATSVFQETLAESLACVFETHDFFNSDQIVVFTEYLGPNSFAGKHKRNDSKSLVLFDFLGASGFMAPGQFIDYFSELPIARVVYRGKLTGKFATDVREGKYSVDEGVVCKGGTTGDVWMVKIKTDEYRQRLQEFYGTNWEKYWE